MGAIFMGFFPDGGLVTKMGWVFPDVSRLKIGYTVTPVITKHFGETENSL